MDMIVDKTNKSVGEYVAEDYRIAEVFEKHGIDFCCGGQIPLVDACREKGIDSAEIKRKINNVLRTAVAPGKDYANWDLSFLIDYIVNTHHAYLNKNNNQIKHYVQKIAEVHGANHPELIEIAAIFGKIVSDLSGHLQEEEEVLFPLIKGAEAAVKSGGKPDVTNCEGIKDSLEKLTKEHEEIGDGIHAIRHLAKDYEIPGDACNTFAVAYQKLQEFENDLHKHVHLENNVLFLKAIQL